MYCSSVCLYVLGFFVSRGLHYVNNAMLQTKNTKSSKRYGEQRRSIELKWDT